MVATSVDIKHEDNFVAKMEVEVVVGTDRVTRINIDGICALRVKALKGCRIVIKDDRNASQ